MPKVSPLRPTKPGRLQEVVRELGFASEVEMYDLMGNFDITYSAEARKAFNKWKVKDGTKAGLLKLYERFS